MEKSNKVFIATSIDGFIADKDGGIGWLDTIPEINTIDTGYADFIANVDALVMGRMTYEKVLSFGIDWPYTKMVYVVSSQLKSVPDELEGKVTVLSGELNDILAIIHDHGHLQLYIDGGSLIQGFLMEDKIDEMVITVIPILLGAGIPLFGTLLATLQFECVKTNHFLGSVVQNHFVRKR